ncbi:8-amino-7-oxononanoate synthase [uncultured Umboniibacter sp.]|uniref:aminotransferase class I/II-fold pyridoxal phosphate-dependent enzyme n=1 Tax=uncultured Umboniibacter sp. TaxID=1798917 RepID=UPI0026141EF9|nr:8-amino-7-oxononanoate synthase [uncultured Umboniibacter sp.]
MLIDRLSARLAIAEQENAKRYVRVRQGVDFASNDYLDFSQRDELKQAAHDAIASHGVGGRASHLVMGHSQHHDELEQRAAQFFGYEAAMVFSSGYAANLGIMAALLAKGDRVLHDRLNHASLLDGGSLSGANFRRFRHNDVAQLRDFLSRSNEPTLVAIESVYSMDGDLADLIGIEAVCREYGATLLVDDAHGVGVIGHHGGGASTAIKPDILMVACGKALGSYGALVCGSKSLVDGLSNFARTYVYTTALPPAQAAVTSAALQLIQENDEAIARLQRNIAHFRRCAQQAGLPLSDSHSAIQPILVGDNARLMALSEQLEAKGFLVGAIRAPTVAKGSERLRISLSAAHTSEQIEQLISEVRSSDLI